MPDRPCGVGIDAVGDAEAASFERADEHAVVKRHAIGRMTPDARARRHHPDLLPVWWSLALGACLGGNATLIGASANVVVAGIAEKAGHKITFMRFLKFGFPFMIQSVLIATVYVWLRYYV